MLLAALLEGPQHGYALKKQAGLISGQTDMHNNLVYPLLRRFVAHGWVTRKKAAGQRGQTRQVYVLTAAGRKSIVDRVCDLDEKAVASGDEFRLRVGLFSILNSTQRLTILDRRQTYLLRRAQRFEPLKKAMNLGEYGGAVILFIEQQIQNELAWIHKLRRRDLRPGKVIGKPVGGKP
ncbi:MAG TPA: PadR family transcriptional regulator [Candidatus Acidoferrales bacterium]